jgi:hypothetical protein
MRAHLKTVYRVAAVAIDVHDGRGRATGLGFYTDLQRLGFI